MAITFASTHSDNGKPNGGMGGYFSGTGTFVGPNPYTVGGEGLDLKALLGLENDPIEVHIEERLVSSTRTYFAQYDYTAKKVVIFVAATGSEAGAIDLSGSTFQVSWKSLP